MAYLGFMVVTVIGGEDYLRDDWTDFFRVVRRCGMQATMTTGGRGITKERAEAARSAGLMSASVSIDGAEATHDRLRGVKGSYVSARAALSHLRGAGIGVSVNTQINRLSVPDLSHVLDLIIEHGGHSWQIQLTVAMGRGADEPDVLLQPYDLAEVFPLIAELKQRADANKVRIWPGNNIGYFGPYETLLRGTMPKGHGSSCGAGRMTLGIEADGTIKGCPSLTTHSWAGGNVRENTLRDIWERSARLRYTRDRTVEDLWGFCRTCYYADECRAGCTWTSDVLFGRPGNNPYCHHRVLELASRGKRERLRQVTAAPGLPFDNGRFEIIEEDLPPPDPNGDDR
jgi:radical SAM protein with 4Fe4S-binding SPASM domain